MRHTDQERAAGFSPRLVRPLLPPMQATLVASHTQRIEALALAVSQLPDVPPTVLQRSLLQSIARELLRRAS